MEIDRTNEVLRRRWLGWTLSGVCQNLRQLWFPECLKHFLLLKAVKA